MWWPGAVGTTAPGDLPTRASAECGVVLLRGAEAFGLKHHLRTDRLLTLPEDLRSGARGATVLRGMWGFHGETAPHGDQLLQWGRRVPLVTIIIDTPEGIARPFDIVDELTAEHGVVASEIVPALTAITGEQQHGGLRLTRHAF